MLVTIVTPSYNQGEFIEETIESVLNQTYPNIQYIIVDGGSKDDTMKIVDRYRSKIDIIIHEKDKGQSDAINKGFKLAKGELVGWINSDDILYPDCVEKIVALAKQNEDGSIYYASNLDFIDKDGKIFRTLKKEIPNKDHLLNNDFYVLQQGSFYRTEHVKKAGYVNEKINYCMDLDLWLRLLNTGNIYFYNEKPLAGFRIWGDTKTSTGGLSFLKDIEDTLRRHGMKFLCKNIRKIYWWRLKFNIKNLIVQTK